MDYLLWIDRKWADTEVGKPMAVQNPATEETPAKVVDASSRDVDRAVRAAPAVFVDGRWLKESSIDRGLPAEAAGDCQVTKHVMVALP